MSTIDNNNMAERENDNSRVLSTSSVPQTRPSEPASSIVNASSNHAEVSSTGTGEVGVICPEHEEEFVRRLDVPSEPCGNGDTVVAPMKDAISTSNTAAAGPQAASRPQTEEAWFGIVRARDVTPMSLRWNPLHILGSGAFGTVCLGLMETGDWAAVKKVWLGKTPLAKVLREVDIQTALDHPGIVKCMGWEKCEEHTNMFLEYIPGGSLGKYIRSVGCLNENLVRTFTRQLLEAVAYMHQRGVVHRDIKGENILIYTGATGIELKVGDFGSAMYVNEEPDGEIGTVRYAAPEIIRGTCHLAADLWSVGCTVIEMLTGSAPWPELRDGPAVMYHVGSGNRPAAPTGLSSEGQDFLNQCFAIKPQRRITAQQALVHPWLAGAP